MDLVDEQDIVLLEVGQQSGQVAGFVQYRARGGTDIYTQFWFARI